MTLFAGCATTKPKVAIYRDPATGTEHICKGTDFPSSGSISEYTENEAAYNTCKDRMEAQGYERVKR
jgi:hypothetical protein